MQDEKETDRRPKTASRVYPPRSKGQRSHIIRPTAQQGGVSEGDSSCTRAPTPHNIDLPPCSLETNVNSVSQTLLGDYLPSPLQTSMLQVQSPDSDNPVCFTFKASKDFDPLDTELRNVATQTQHETSHTSAQNLKLESNSRDSVKSFILQDSQVCKRTPLYLCNSSREGSFSNGIRKSNSQEENVIGYVQQNKVKFLKQIEEVFCEEELKRPQHQVVGFLEDHAEFGSDWLDTMEGKGRYAPSILESTVDGSIVKGARRSYRSRVSPSDLNFFINTAIKNGGGDQDPLISLDELGLKTEQHKYKCSHCEMMSRSRSDVEQHIAASWEDHSEAVVVVLLGNQARGRSCPICNIRLQRTHFFKHIRNSHGSFFPLRCGYCVFLGQDHNQLRHHIRKKHGTSKYHIIDIPRLLAENDLIDNKSSLMGDEAGSDEDYDEDDTSPTGNMLCPVCGRGLKTLANLKKHLIHHSKQKQRCVLCPFTTSFPTQIRSHYRRRHPSETPQWQTVLLEKSGSDALVEDVTPYLKLVTTKYGVRQPKKEGKWMRQYRCPHCDYTCNYNSSYNRHLRLHDGVKPYKCGYCDFHAREAYVVRKHCSKVHKGKKTIIENDRDFKAPYRYASRIKKEKCEWLDNNDEGEEEFNSLATSSFSLSLQSKMKSENESPISQLEKVTCRTSNESKCNRKLGENESTIENTVPIVSPITENSVCINTIKKILSYEDRGSKEYQTETPWKPCLRSQLKKNLKSVGELQMAYPTPKVSVTEGQSACHINNVQTVSMTENISVNTVQEARETRVPRKVNNEVMNGNTGEIISLRSLLKPNCSQEQNAQQLQRGEAQIFKPSTIFQGSLPVKVKTFKLNQESRTEIVKTSSGLKNNRTHTYDRETNIVTSSCSDNEEMCSISLSVPEIIDVNEKAVIINLVSTDRESLRLEKITYCSVSSEIQGSGDQKYSDINKQYSSHSKNTNCISGGLLKSSNDETMAAKCTKVEKTPERDSSFFKSKVDQCGNQESRHQGESQLTAPAEGLENNLYTHIAFLTDSRVQRLSNRISATPGVMTRDLLGLDYSNSDYFCSEKVRLMMKKKKGGRVKCRECGTTTTYRAFYKHAKKHFNIKPFKCGYCSYRSIEKSKIRVHNTFCHPNSPCIILKLSPENAGVNSSAANLSTKNEIRMPNNEGEKGSSLQASGNVSLVSRTTTNSLSSSTNASGYSSNSTVQKMSSAMKKTATPNNNPTTPASSASDVMVCSPQRQPPFQCPICHKILQKHTPSIRRHLYSHYGYKPYKCGYCNFTGIGQSEVRAHHVTHGFTTLPKVEPSGIPIPAGLTPYINGLLTHHRVGRPLHKKKTQLYQQNSSSQLRQASSGGPDLVWTESEAVSKDDLSTLYLTQQHLSQQGLVSYSQQGGLDSLNVETCPIPQPLQSEDLTSEAAYAVQVLESGQNASSPGTLQSQLDLSIVTDSHSELGSDSVCVVYLVE